MAIVVGAPSTTSPAQIRIGAVIPFIFTRTVFGIPPFSVFGNEVSFGATGGSTSWRSVSEQMSYSSK